VIGDVVCCSASADLGSMSARGGERERNGIDVIFSLLFDEEE
jgi:hypothetical protein